MNKRSNVPLANIRNTVPLVNGRGGGSRGVAGIDSGSGSSAPRKRADARRNEVTLLDAAAAAFIASGVGVPVRDIAAKAGVGVGTIYRHFPTRADLIVAVYRHQVEACAEAGPALLADEPYTARRPGPVDQPLRRLPGHQARPRRGAAVRRCRLRDSACLFPRPPRPRVRPVARRRGPGGRDPGWHGCLRTAAWCRQSLYRRGPQPPLQRTSYGRARHRRTTPPARAVAGAFGAEEWSGT